MLAWEAYAIRCASSCRGLPDLSQICKKPSLQIQIKVSYHYYFSDIIFSVIILIELFLPTSFRVTDGSLFYFISVVNYHKVYSHHWSFTGFKSKTEIVNVTKDYRVKSNRVDWWKNSLLLYEESWTDQEISRTFSLNMLKEILINSVCPRVWCITSIVNCAGQLMHVVGW